MKNQINQKTFLFAEIKKKKKIYQKTRKNSFFLFIEISI